ncbi:MAG: 30S ribosomal protein S20 [Patescibacteria group bacterium]|nr:30S ribosomal protein S20 [Patescibacteria group bacterium]
MPNKQASIKHLRQTKKRQAHNDKLKSYIKFLTNASKKALDAKNFEEAKTHIAHFQQIMDKAVKVGIVKKNKASRKKSTLMKSLAKAGK